MKFDDPDGDECFVGVHFAENGLTLCEQAIVLSQRETLEGFVAKVAATCKDSFLKASAQACLLSVRELEADLPIGCKNFNKPFVVTP